MTVNYKLSSLTTIFSMFFVYRITTQHLWNCL